MTDNLQPLYDILGEAFQAGRHFDEADSPTASQILFPLAARMEEEIQKLVEDGRKTEIQVAAGWLKACSESRDGLRALGIFHQPTSNRWRMGRAEYTSAVTAADRLREELLAYRAMSLPSSPEREI